MTKTVKKRLQAVVALLVSLMIMVGIMPNEPFNTTVYAGDVTCYFDTGYSNTGWISATTLYMWNGRDWYEMTLDTDYVSRGNSNGKVFRGVFNTDNDLAFSTVRNWTDDGNTCSWNVNSGYAEVEKGGYVYYNAGENVQENKHRVRLGTYSTSQLQSATPSFTSYSVYFDTSKNTLDLDTTFDVGMTTYHAISDWATTDTMYIITANE